jgi:hypothetical protein
VQECVEDSGEHAEHEVSEQEGDDVAAPVVAIEDARRRHRVGHPRVQVREGADDDAAEQTVHGPREQAPQGQVVVAATAAKNVAYNSTIATATVAWPHQPARRRTPAGALRTDPPSSKMS